MTGAATIKKACLTALLIVAGISRISSAQEETRTFQYRVNADRINIRSDSTVSSQTICKVNKGDYLEVISELYEWYKVRLPKQAPSFVKSNLTGPIDQYTARITKDNVNIRLLPDDSSPIIGKAKKEEIIYLLEEKRGWLRIEPVKNSFGWINKNFVDKSAAINIIRDTAKNTQQPQQKIAQENPGLTLIGLIKPKFIKTIATHKLITEDNKIFLLKGDKRALNAFSHRNAKVTGKLIPSDTQKDALFEIIKIEALD